MFYLTVGAQLKTCCTILGLSIVILGLWTNWWSWLPKRLLKLKSESLWAVHRVFRVAGLHLHISCMALVIQISPYNDHLHGVWYRGKTWISRSWWSYLGSCPSLLQEWKVNWVNKGLVTLNLWFDNFPHKQAPFIKSRNEQNDLTYPKGATVWFFAVGCNLLGFNTRALLLPQWISTYPFGMYTKTWDFQWIVHSISFQVCFGQ